MRIRYISATLVSVAAFCLVGCSSPDASAKGTQAATAPAPPAAPVKVGRVEIRQMPVEVAAMGNVEPYSTITVKALIGGTITKVHFREGDMVRKDDLLFDIDCRPHQEAVRQLEANVARGRALLQLGEANLARAQSQEAHYTLQADRYLKLAEQGIFSREQAEQMNMELRSRRSNVRAERASIESAKAVIHADEAALEGAKVNLSYCSIRSPINGRTGQVFIKAGNVVKANDVDLVTIHQIQPIDVAFSVPETSLNAIRRRVSAGSCPSVRVNLPSETAVLGTLTFIDNAVDKATGTVRLKASFGNGDNRLWPGQFVDVMLRLDDRPNAVAAPAAAIQAGQAGTFVYMLTPDNTVELRPVTVGSRFDNMTAIESGLKGGEQVVTDGQLRLAPGAKVRVLQ